MAIEVLYDAPGLCRATFDGAKSEVYVIWEKFPAAGHFRPCLDAQVKVVAAGKAKFVIVDVQKTTGVPFREDQEYLVNEVFPKYKAAGLQAIVTLLPESALTKMGARQWQSTGAQFGFKMYETGSLADAAKLLAAEFGPLRRAS